MMKERIIIDTTKAKEIEKLLSLPGSVDLEKLGYPQYSCIETFTTRFENGNEVDVKLCTSGDDFFIISFRTMLRFVRNLYI